MSVGINNVLLSQEVKNVVKIRSDTKQKMNPLVVIVWGSCLFLSTITQTEAKIRTTDAFMSSADLQNIFKLEQSLVGTLRQYKEQLDKSLYHIRHYVSEVEELYKNEDCYPADKCDDKRLQERIVSNPIYNYQMLKRLLVYWKTMEDTIKKIDSKRKYYPIQTCIPKFVILHIMYFCIAVLHS